MFFNTKTKNKDKRDFRLPGSPSTTFVTNSTCEKKLLSAKSHLDEAEHLKCKSGAGFTLIEIIVTVSIFSVLVFGAAIMLNDIFVNSTQQLLSMSNIDQARAVSATFTNEIRNAVTGNDGSYPLNQAGDNQIIFYSKFGAASGIVNRIRYYVSGNTLYKGIIAPTGSPLAYNLSSESIKPVQNSISNASVPIFYYYDGNYDGGAGALLQPINVNQVRFVKINLIVLNQIKKNDTSTFSTSTGAAIRSVKDNLGN